MALFDRMRGRADKTATVAAQPAVITGIRARSDDTTEIDFRLEWDDGAAHVGAIRFGAGAPPVLRLGSTVLVRSDGSGIVLDVAAMRGAPATPTDPGRKKRSAPDPGVDDKAQDSRALSRVKKWPSQRGTIVSWDRVSVFGVAADNWNLVVRRADGGSGRCSRESIPTYARWFVHPGSEVPITVDPRDSSRLQVDWAGLAAERAGGTWDDLPPEGSVAAALVGYRPHPSGTATAGDGT